MKEELEEARQAMMEGRGQEAEMQRQMEEKMERERQQRIARTQEQAMRRIFKQDLARGWQCWYDLYWEKTWEKNLLKGASARLI